VTDPIHLHIADVLTAVPAHAGVEAGMVMLTEDEAPYRSLRIIIGQPEANAIMVGWHGNVPGRPSTWDLFVSTVALLGARLDRVVITAVHEERHYFAHIELEHGGERRILACRPSDAIALAVRGYNVDILAEPSVLDAAGVLPDGTKPGPPTESAAGPDAGLARREAALAAREAELAERERLIHQREQGAPLHPEPAGPEPAGSKPAVDESAYSEPAAAGTAPAEYAVADPEPAATDSAPAVAEPAPTVAGPVSAVSESAPWAADPESAPPAAGPVSVVSPEPAAAESAPPEPEAAVAGPESAVGSKPAVAEPDLPAEVAPPPSSPASGAP
jgi:bifunctional DNase/RNase